MNKDILRTEARKHRARIDPLSEDPEKAVDLFFSAIKPQPHQIIAGYFPTPREFDALHILEHALSQNFTCALPVIEKDTRILKFIQWDKSAKMTPNIHGIQEPQEDETHTTLAPDIIIVPLLAFDRKGTRLGQGGGYYDATLAHYRAKKDLTAVGMAYSQQAVLFKLPQEEHDEQLDWVITPKEAHYFRK